MGNKKLIYSIGLFVIGLLVILSFVYKPKDPNEQAFLERNNLENKSVEEIALYLDRITNEKDGFFAGIKAKTLTMGDDTSEITLDVPKGKFYLSVAPYINSTHPCANHNLVTCRGELRNKEMNVVVKDEDGKVIINDEYTSFENGFIGLWLPSGITGTITITYDGLSATSEISTNTNSNTCLTTMKLA